MGPFTFAKTHRNNMARDGQTLVSWSLGLPSRMIASLMGYNSNGSNYPRVKFDSRERAPSPFNGTYQDALKQAKDEFKFMLVYLHSGFHEDTPKFMRDVLCSELVSAVIDEHFVFFAADMRSAEGLRVSYALNATSYPFLGVICNVTASAVMQDSLQQLGFGQIRTSGALLLKSWSGLEDQAVFSAPGVLAAALNEFFESKSPLLVAAKAERIRQQTSTNRSIIEEQNQAYLESLRQDEEKARQREKEIEEKRKAEKEAADRERRLQEEKEREIREREAKEREAEERRATLSAVVDEEPPASDQTTQLMIRLSDGTKLKRRFLKTDKLANLFVFIAAKEPQPKYSVVTHFPRAALTDGSLTFADAKLVPQATIFVEEDV